MEQLNDFYKIITNNYNQNGDITKNSIYDEIMKREKDVKQIIDRVIEMKDKEKLNKKLFTNTQLNTVFTKTFAVLNDIMEDTTKVNDLSYKRFRKIIGKEQRSIYIGIFLVLIAISLALIEVSDAL